MGIVFYIPVQSKSSGGFADTAPSFYVILSSLELEMDVEQLAEMHQSHRTVPGRPHTLGNLAATDVNPLMARTWQQTLYVSLGWVSTVARLMRWNWLVGRRSR